MININHHDHHWMTRERAYRFAQDVISMLICTISILLREGEQYMTTCEIFIGFTLGGCHHDTIDIRSIVHFLQLPYTCYHFNYRLVQQQHGELKHLVCRAYDDRRNHIHHVYQNTSGQWVYETYPLFNLSIFSIFNKPSEIQGHYSLY